MLKEAAIRYYGSQAAIAAALEISESAVSQWPRTVPFEAAKALEELTGGACPVDRSQYRHLARIDRLARMGSSRRISERSKRV